MIQEPTRMKPSSVLSQAFRSAQFGATGRCPGTLSRDTLTRGDAVAEKSAPEPGCTLPTKPGFLVGKAVLIPS